MSDDGSKIGIRNSFDWKRWIASPGFLLALLTIVVIGIYLPALGVPPYLDDYSAIINNSRITKLEDFSNILQHFFTGRGLVQLSFIFEWHTFSNAIRAMHVSNILFHLLAVLLVYFCTRSIWKFLHPDITGDSHWKYYGLAAAALFALHPINTQPVTYIVARSDVMATIFYLLGIWIPLIVISYFSKRGGGAIQTGIAAILTLFLVGFFMALGFSCKEIAVTLPVVFWLLLIGSWRRLPIGIFLLRIVLCIVPVLLAIGAYLMYRKSVMGGYLLIEDLQARPPLVNLYTQICILVFYYIPRLLFPVNLLFRPPFPLTTSWLDPRLLISLSLLGIILVGTVLCFRKKPEIAFGWLWFLVALSPTSSILPLWDLIAERRIYLPLVGLVLMAESLFFTAWKSSRFRGKQLLPAFLFSGLVLFSVLSFLRNAEYRHPIRFWQKEHAYSPYNLENLHNYLYALSQEGHDGQVKDILTHLDWNIVKEKNDTVDTGSLDALIRLMLNYRVEVDYATLLAQKNAEKFPNQPLMLHTYQLALMVQQRFKDAMDVIDQTLKTDPNHVDTLLNQAYIYRIFGHFDLARSAVERALSLSPEYIPSLEELAELLKSTNQDASVVEKKIQDLRKQNKFANELELKSSL